MNAVATTWVDIVRGSSQDENDDDTDLGIDDSGAEHIAWNEPASLIERSVNSYSRAAGTDRNVRYASLRTRSGLQIRKGDRVRDRRTTLIWIVDTPSDIQNPAYTADTRVDLRRTV